MKNDLQYPNRKMIQLKNFARNRPLFNKRIPELDLLDSRKTMKVVDEI